MDTLDYVPDASDSDNTDDDTDAEVRKDVHGATADVADGANADVHDGASADVADGGSTLNKNTDDVSGATAVVSDGASAAHDVLDDGDNHSDNAAVSLLPLFGVQSTLTARSVPNVHVCNDGFSNIQDDVRDSNDELQLHMDEHEQEPT